MEVVRAHQTSQDGLTWDTPTTLADSSPDTATPQFVPMTGPIDTTLVKDVRAARWLEAATPNLTTRVGYQMSDDGVTWSATVTGIGSWSATAGWVYNDDAAVAVTTDQRLFVPFGLLGANSSGTLIEQGLGRLSIDVRPVVGRTLAVEGAKVFTNGSTLTTGRVFHRLVGPVPLEEMARAAPLVTTSSASVSFCDALRPIGGRASAPGN